MGRATLRYKKPMPMSATRPGAPQFSMKLARLEYCLYSPFLPTFHRHRMPYQPTDAPPSARRPTQDHHVRIVQGARLPSRNRQEPAPGRADHEGPIRPDMHLVDLADDLRREIPEQRFISGPNRLLATDRRVVRGQKTSVVALSAAVRWIPAQPISVVRASARAQRLRLPNQSAQGSENTPPQKKCAITAPKMVPTNSSAHRHCAHSSRSPENWTKTSTTYTAQ